MPYLETPDKVELYYREWGVGTPVVLIHGWPLNSDMWERQAEFLSNNNCRVVTYDRRGFGRSGQPWLGYDYGTFASDLNRLMEHLDLQNAVLVGFSMGGGEVARYLSSYGSQRVAKAVMIGSITPYLLKTVDNPEGIDPDAFIDMEVAIRKDRPAFLRDFGQKFYGRSALHHTVSEDILDWTQEMAYTTTLHPMIATAHAWEGTDFREDLRRIDVPVLLIHGTEDVIVPASKSSRRAADLLQNCVLSEYGGEPHGLFVTASDRLNMELLGFIEGRPLALIPETEPGVAGTLPIGEVALREG
jgi:pimeloyl-ACP methyl ester carboxylesterase